VQALLKAVVMDVDGTMYRQGRVRLHVAVQMLRFAIFHPLMAWKSARALAAYRRAQEELRTTGQPGAAYLQTAQAARRTGYEEAFISRCVDHWMSTVPLPALEKARRPGLLAFLDWAQAEGLRLAVVSDYDAGSKLRALRADRYFSTVVCACDPGVGVFKPNPLGLQVALRRLGGEPAEALYVGDRLEVDGAAALAAGMAAALISTKAIDCPAGVIAVDSWLQVQNLTQDRVHRAASRPGWLTN
jgi:FMN phosphatase YigB (HAD superfamily)